MPILTRVCEADPDIIHHGWGVMFWLRLSKWSKERADRAIDKAFMEVQWVRDAEDLFTEGDSLEGQLAEMNAFSASIRMRNEEEEDE